MLVSAGTAELGEAQGKGKGGVGWFVKERRVLTWFTCELVAAWITDERDSINDNFLGQWSGRNC